MDLVILLPALTAILALVFSLALFDQWRERRGGFQLIWGFGMLFFGIAAGAEALAAIGGWNEALYRTWYLTGAVWTAGWLGLGTAYLLGRTRFGYSFALCLFFAGLFTFLIRNRPEYAEAGTVPLLYFIAAGLLESSGFTVDILPATIPPRYSADLFIALHADAFSSPSASGFSIAPPRRDATGRAASFAEILAGTYAEGTSLRRRGMTRTMRGYYAFNYRRYRHALDPGTVAVILETGFLTSPSDRRVIVDDPDRSARAIVAAVRCPVRWQFRATDIVISNEEVQADLDYGRDS